jgi:hypothetical protein
VEGQEAVSVEAADIARAKPALSESSLIEFWRIEIARYHGGTTHPDLTPLAGWQGMSILTNDGHGIRPRLPASPWPVRPGRRQVGGDLRSFAGAVMLQHRHAQNALQVVLHLFQQRRATRYDEPQSVRRGRFLKVFCLVQHGSVKRRTCRVPCRPQDIEPLIQGHDGTVRRDGNAAAR